MVSVNRRGGGVTSPGYGIRREIADAAGRRGALTRTLAELVRTAPRPRGEDAARATVEGGLASPQEGADAGDVVPDIAPPPLPGLVPSTSVTAVRALTGLAAAACLVGGLAGAARVEFTRTGWEATSGYALNAVVVFVFCAAVLLECARRVARVRTPRGSLWIGGAAFGAGVVAAGQALECLTAWHTIAISSLTTRTVARTGADPAVVHARIERMVADGRIRLSILPTGWLPVAAAGFGLTAMVVLWARPTKRGAGLPPAA
jgi:hypothetical protein